MADAGRIVSACRSRPGRDQPAGIGGTGQGTIGLAEQQAHDAVLAGAERQAAACSQIELAWVATKFGEHGGEAAAAQSFLEHPEDILGFRHPNDDEPRRVDAERGKAGAIGGPGLMGRGGFGDPQHGTVVLCREAGEDGGGEAGHGGGIAALVAAHFVERSAAKATGEQSIEGGNSEGECVAAAARGKRGRGAGETCTERGENRFLPCFRGRGYAEFRVGIVAGFHPGVRLDLRDPATQAGKVFPCHGNAGAHGFPTRRWECVPVSFY
jgi:hypothetical protein